MAKKATAPKGPDESALAECLLRVPSGEPIRQSGAQGIFPGGKDGPALFQHALSLGYVEACEPPPAPAPRRKTGKAPTKPAKAVPHARVTVKGREWALQQTSPQKALEQLLPVLQALGATAGAGLGEVSEIQAQVGELQDGILRIGQAIQDAVARRRQETDRLTETIREAISVTQRLTTTQPRPTPDHSPTSPPAVLDSELTSFVGVWQQQRGTGCPLPELYRHLHDRFPGLTIGTFHDRLRALHASHSLRLSGMSGSLDTLRDPEMALLISSKVMYYANVPDATT